MKRLFLLGLLLLSSSSFLSSVYGQSPELNGKWVLEKVQLLQYSDNNQDSIPVTYKENKNNMNSGIFNELTFEKGQCSTTLNENPITSGYSSESNELQLYFMAVPITYSFTWDNQSKTQFTLFRKFYDMIESSGNKTGGNFGVWLTYTKK